jgi:hypothetical protein
MPTKEARDAFAESQRLSARMGEIHAEELKLLRKTGASQCS